jgi:hypothetical protein
MKSFTIKNLPLYLTIIAFSLLTGCASVPLADAQRDAAAKTWTVAPGKANIYVYRNERMGRAVKMAVTLDGRAVGDTVAWTYLALEVTPGKHRLVSQAENDSALELETQAGHNYYVWQEVKMGLLSARSALQIVDEETGRAGIEDCELIETK